MMIIITPMKITNQPEEPDSWDPVTDSFDSEQEIQEIIIFGILWNMGASMT